MISMSSTTVWALSLLSLLVTIVSAVASYKVMCAARNRDIALDWPYPNHPHVAVQHALKEAYDSTDPDTPERRLALRLAQEEMDQLDIIRGLTPKSPLDFEERKPVVPKVNRVRHDDDLDWPEVDFYPDDTPRQILHHWRGRTFTADQLSNMSIEEYVRYRAQLLEMARGITGKTAS